MVSVTAKVKKWGNSLGIVIPKETVNEENIEEGDELEVIMIKKTDVIKETFGMLKGKLKRNTDEVLAEVDRELWGIKRKT